MADSGDWCLIESDPGVFTELISNLGVKGVQVEEVWDLGSETLGELEPVYGLIFLFKWVGGTGEESRPGAKYASEDEPVFFAKQVIQNACATQAILSVLLNSEKVELGDELQQFKSFTGEFPSEMKGLAISNSDVIRSVHNSFARSDPFINEIVDSSSEKEDAFHFISYVPTNGSLYELDGLAPAPVNLGSCTQDNWIEKVRPVIQERMNRYLSSGEIRFNLMAICRSRADVYQEQLSQRRELQAQAPNSQSTTAESLRTEIVILEDKLHAEKEKLDRYHKENLRRRHNFIPLIYELLTQLAARGKLSSAIEEAKTATKQKVENQRKRKAEQQLK